MVKVMALALDNQTQTPISGMYLWRPVSSATVHDFRMSSGTTTSTFAAAIKLPVATALYTIVVDDDPRRSAEQVHEPVYPEEIKSQ
ncbi:hypothetical protein AVEN_253234-1 [Araneus ventricosus]|uniref:Uncharacterized protein n=1 Tax=Araneus ventricosus TaxID=182803 RepID=A0A4Y2SVK2_ARAVE|nr:hypothetical protein AVEN_191417-1 [Araneus ventricosus]GBN92352.1 hypothetical protein AVEN_253234-1 [Araneus ventricosus]